MRFDAFEAAAWRYWDEVPSEYKHGVDGLRIERDARAHPELAGVYTLGECNTETFPSDFGGPDTTRSAVVLYYGSFLRLAQVDVAFDWDRELKETIEHELQHHLEALAAEDALEDVDYAVDENFKRLEGEPFDPLFFRAGVPLERDRYRVEEDVFIEVAAEPVEAQAGWITFEWEGTRYRVARPSRLGDVTFVRVLGATAVTEGELNLVLVRRRSAVRTLFDVLRKRRSDVREEEAQAELIA